MRRPCLSLLLFFPSSIWALISDMTNWTGPTLPNPQITSFQDEAGQTVGLGVVLPDSTRARGAEQDGAREVNVVTGDDGQGSAGLNDTRRTGTGSEGSAKNTTITTIRRKRDKRSQLDLLTSMSLSTFIIYVAPTSLLCMCCVYHCYCKEDPEERQDDHNRGDKRKEGDKRRGHYQDDYYYMTHTTYESGGGDLFWSRSEEDGGGGTGEVSGGAGDACDNQDGGYDGGDCGCDGGGDDGGGCDDGD